MLAWNGETLNSADNGGKGTTVPSQGGAVNLATVSVQVTGNGRCHHATSSASASSETVDHAKGTGRGGSLFDEDQEERIEGDGEDVANSEASVDGWEDEGLGDNEEHRHKCVCDGVKYGYNEEKLVHTNPFGTNREDDGLHEQGNDTVDSHDHTDRADRQAQPSRRVKGRHRTHRGSLQQSVGALVLEEDGHQVVVGHGVVGEDAESDNQVNDSLAEDVLGRRLLTSDVFGLFVDVDGAVGLRAEIHSRTLHSI